MSNGMKSERNDLLNHAVKAIKYRFEKATLASLENFGEFKVGQHTRTPSEIINHMFDLVNKTNCKIEEGHFNCSPPEQLNFKEECKRFITRLETLNETLQYAQIEMDVCKKLLQGPLLDITTHIGQIALLNGLNQNKIPKENYYAIDL
jgi:hypothetical protein